MRYGVAITAAALATVLRLLLNPVLETHLPYITYFIATLLTAWYAGTGPARLAMVVGLIVAWTFSSPAVPVPAMLIRSTLYLLVGLGGIRLFATLRSAKRRAENAARETRVATEQLTRTLESMSDAFVALDREWRYLFLNQKAAELCRRPREQLVGKKIWEEPEALLNKFYAELQRASTERVPIHFQEYYAPFESWFEVDAYPTEEGLSVFSREITERKRAEEERAQLLAREHAVRREAERTNRLKDDFLATLSHELRTPATAILGWARMLRSGKLDEATREQALEIIERNAKIEAQLLEEILDISRIIRGKLRLDVRPVEIPGIVEAAMDAIRPTAETKGIRLEKALNPTSAVVLGDPERLEQVLWNLLTNAVKFTPRGGRVEVRLERIDSHIEIIVTDTGEGIRPEFLTYLFERFHQGDSSTARPHPGLGLGLAIVRHLVELHGGVVRAASPGEGQGATFTVRLPLLPISFRQRERAHPTGPSDVRLDGLPVLVVEDEPDARLLLSSVLSQHGATVTTAASTAEAMESLEFFNPAVVVSDIGMPGEDGYAFIQRMRAFESERRGRRVPAIALTAYARAEDRVRALEAGYEIHLAKPIEPADLVLAVARSVGGGRQTEMKLPPGSRQDGQRSKHY